MTGSFPLRKPENAPPSPFRGPRDENVPTDDTDAIADIAAGIFSEHPHLEKRDRAMVETLARMQLMMSRITGNDRLSASQFRGLANLALRYQEALGMTPRTRGSKGKDMPPVGGMRG